MKEPKVEETQGTKRGPEEMQEAEQMKIQEVETNDENNEVSEWDDKWIEGDTWTRRQADLWTQHSREQQDWRKSPS